MNETSRPVIAAVVSVWQSEREKYNRSINKKRAAWQQADVPEPPINVRYWHKADMAGASQNVRFRGKSGHCLLVFGVLVAQNVKAAARGPSEKGSSAKFGGPFRARSLATPARALRGDSSRAKRKVDDCSQS